jgi:Fe2+ transport system protein FeoA
MNPPPASALTLCRATHLPRGARGLVAAVEGGSERVERLAAMGVVPGTAFRVVRAGTPMAMAFGEARLAFGREWSDALVVARQ